MRFCSLPFFVTLLIPAISIADDSFVYNRQPAPVQQQQIQQYEYEQQQQMPTSDVGQQGGVVMQQPASAAMGYVQQGGAYGNPGMASASNDQRAYINTGGNIHEIPSTPPGWDSLTTGTMNGGGVLGNNNGMNNGFGNNGSNPLGLNGNQFTDGTAANELLGSMATGSARQTYGNVGVTSDGSMSPSERAAYAVVLGSLLQAVQGQPNTVSGSSPGYNGAGWQPVTPAYNSSLPAQGAQQFPRFGVQQGGTMGISAPAVPCPRGGIAGVNC